MNDSIKIPDTLTETQADVVKAAAANAYKRMGIRDETADYLFGRFVQRQAVKTAAAQKNARVAKLAATFRKRAAK